MAAAELSPEKLREAAWRGFRRFLLDAMPRRLSYILGDERAARLIIEASEKATIEGFKEMLASLGMDPSGITTLQAASMVARGINEVMSCEFFSPDPVVSGDKILVECRARDACSLPVAGIAFFLGMFSGALRLLGRRAAALHREPGREDRVKLCRLVVRPEYLVWFDQASCSIVVEKLTCR